MPLIAITRVNNVKNGILQLCGKDDEFCYSENIGTQELGMTQKNFLDGFVRRLLSPTILFQFVLTHHKKRPIVQNIFNDLIETVLFNKFFKNFNFFNA